MAWTKPQLEAYAEAHDINISGLSTKQQILDAITLAEG